LEQKEVLYDETNAFTDKESPMYYLDFTITYRLNKKHHSGVWALQVKNALGSPNYDGFSYNYRTRTIGKEEDVIVLPILSYKIEF
ncbi:MAG TPA: prevent-host-death protein, partial [Bacteroidales bacterium]